MRSRAVPRPALPAFTLLELLVAVAILSVLAGILLPVLAKARQRAYQSVCLSNLKQIGSAFALYLENWDGRFPLESYIDERFRADVGKRWTPSKTWKHALLPYLRSIEVLICPTNPCVWWKWSSEEGIPAGDISGMPISYAMNYRLVEGVGPSQDCPDLPIALSEIEEPSRLIVVGETRGIAVWMNEFFADCRVFPDVSRHPLLAPGQGLFHSHMGRINFLYADWHAKAVRFIDTVYPKHQFGFHDYPFNELRPEEELKLWEQIQCPEYR